MLVVRDQHIDPIFADRCTAVKELCVSDELYVPTLLASYNAAHEVRVRERALAACPIKAHGWHTGCSCGVPVMIHAYHLKASSKYA